MKPRRSRSLGAISILGFAVQLWVVATPWTTALAETLEIRAISATSGTAQTDSSLGDLLPLLRRHLPNYTGFKLLDRCTIRLPAESYRASLAGRLTLHCQGSSQRLALTVTDHERVIIQTQVSLRTNIPLVFAGVPERQGILAIAIVLRR